MSVYKEPNTNKWRAVYRYTDFTGTRRQTQKRGFATRREALAWEAEQLRKKDADLDMTLESFIDLYKEDLSQKLKRNTWESRRFAPPFHR